MSIRTGEGVEWELDEEWLYAQFLEWYYGMQLPYSAHLRRARPAREIRPGMVLVPKGFRCPECGCTETRKGPGFTECAWCGGNGRRVKT